MNSTKTQVTRIAAYGLVLDDSNRILLCRISDKLSHLTGMWTLPGGGIEFREDPIDAMIREVREETGLLVESQDLAGVDSTSVDIENIEYHSIRIIYRAKLLGGELTNEIDGTTDLCQWWSLNDLQAIKLVDLAEIGISMAFE